jgi:orotidine-5'-phosphate decarboxylase
VTKPPVIPVGFTKDGEIKALIGAYVREVVEDLNQKNARILNLHTSEGRRALDEALELLDEAEQ